MNNTPLHLLRDCPAIRIPSGDPILLKKDQEVVITQSLGGSYTVMTTLGIARINAENADALGLEAEASTEAAAVEQDEVLTPEELTQRAWERLKTVYDPEIPVNIVDLGLVYSLEIKNEGQRIEADMTLTAPGCGMGPTIQADAQSKLLTLPGIKEAEVRLVWEPAWNQDMITEHGKMKLGMI
ncbi:MAG: iron-sulfur cluster assembly protein [Candidatus Methylacidiphilales bacterium]